MSEEEQNYDALFKIVLVGDSGVGKSNLLLRLLNKPFCENSKATVGVEFGVHMLKLQDAVIRAQIWDTAGQERYRAITSAYYKGAQGAIIVFDITSQSSFESVERWITDLKNNGDEKIIILLIGNKNDLEENRQVPKDKAEEKAKNHQMAYIETSAKNCTNVAKAFEIIIKDMYEAFKSEEPEDDGGVHLEPDSNAENMDVTKEEKKSCC
ncbi:MAG: GTP-binding protein [archaeon]|nr:GTP-binding protein [archaeon]